MPGRCVDTNRSPVTGSTVPPSPNTAPYVNEVTVPARPSRAAPDPPHTSGVSPRVP